MVWGWGVCCFVVIWERGRIGEGNVLCCVCYDKGGDVVVGWMCVGWVGLLFWVFEGCLSFCRIFWD